MIFSSVEQAESWLEPVDCEDGNAICYDSTGLKLRVLVEQEHDSLLFIKWSTPVVRIRVSEPIEKGPGALRQILVRALSALKEDDRDAGLTELALEDLQERAMKHCLVGVTR